jgi:hypothetical protein
MLMSRKVFFNLINKWIHHHLLFIDNNNYFFVLKSAWKKHSLNNSLHENLFKSIHFVSRYELQIQYKSIRPMIKTSVQKKRKP